MSRIGAPPRMAIPDHLVVAGVQHHGSTSLELPPSPALLREEGCELQRPTASASLLASTSATKSARLLAIHASSRAPCRQKIRDDSRVSAGKLGADAIVERSRWALARSRYERSPLRQEKRLDGECRPDSEGLRPGTETEAHGVSGRRESARNSSVDRGRR